MIDPLILGLFVSSEAYASGVRKKAAMDEKIANTPQGVYFDSKNKTLAYGDANKGVGVQVGSYTPAKGRGSFTALPKEILNLMLPKPPSGKIPYYVSTETNKKYSTISALKQTEGQKMSYRTQYFDRATGFFDFPSKEIFDKGKPTKNVVNGFVSLDNPNEFLTKRPKNGYLATKTTEGDMTTISLKSQLPSEKAKDPKVIGTRKDEIYTIDGVSGTLSELVANRTLSSEEASDISQTGAKQIGTEITDVYDDGSTRLKNTVNFNKTQLETIYPELAKRTEEKKDVEYKIDYRTPKGLIVRDFPVKDQNWKLASEELAQEGNRVLHVHAKIDGKKEYFGENSNSRKNAMKNADVRARVVASFNFGTKNEPPVEFLIPEEIGDLEKVSEFLSDTNSKLTKILSKNAQRDFFYKDPLKVTKLGSALLRPIKRMYTKEGVVGATNMKFYMPVDEFLRDYPALSAMKMTLPDGSELDYASFVKQFQNKQISTDTLNQMLNIEKRNGSKTVSTIKEITSEGLNIKASVISEYKNENHIKAVNTILSFAKNNDDIAYYSNKIQGLTKFSSEINPETGTPFPANEQPVFNLINKLNSPSFSRTVTIDNKRVKVTGPQLLQAMLNKEQEAVDQVIKGPLIRSISTQVANAGNNDLTNMADILDVFLPKDAESDIDITLQNAYKFIRGQESSSKQKVILASVDMEKAVSQAKAEANALRKTYFDPQGNMYPEGAGLADAYVYVDGLLYVGNYLIDTVVGGIKSATGNDPQIIRTATFNSSQILEGARKRVNAFTNVFDDPRIMEDEKLRAEVIRKYGSREKELEARAKSKKELEGIINRMASKNEKTAAFARRSFHKYMLAYQLAAAIQGGTGGRTISDQDVQNILNAFNFRLPSRPEHEVEAIDAAINMLERMRAYHSAVASLQGNPTPAQKRKAMLIIEADRMLANQGGLAVNGMTSTQIANQISEKGRGSGVTGTGEKAIEATEEEKRNFNFLNKNLGKLL